MLRHTCIVIVGPTAVGKSALAVRLAKRLTRTKWGGFSGAEIISADSRQVYTGLDIGTGKITKKEMQGVPHHLLDVVSPGRQFSVAEYQKLGEKAMHEILSRGKLPIVVGGTGLYVDALVRGTVFPEVPPNLKLRKQFEKKSAGELFSMLKRLDPRRAKTIDRHNPRRLVRAIEIAKELGSVPAYSVILENNSIDNAVLYIGLTLPNDELKRRIAIRLLARIDERKMLAEVRRLHTKGLSCGRMEELGLEYRYVSRYLRKELTKEEMLGKLQTEIWRYAKRQMTWFKRNKDIQWFSPKEVKGMTAAIKRFLDAGFVLG